MMWQDMWAALALVLVIEGMLPFISPASMRNAMRQMAQMDDRTLRIAGLVSMIAGLLLLALVR
jgi:uncharacterized protein YjeT (DUF2065 family)